MRILSGESAVRRGQDEPSGSQRNMFENNRLKVFSGRGNIALAEKIVRHLGDSLGRVTLSNFPDGENSVRIEEDVRGRDIFVVQPTCPPVNENLMELLI